MSGWLKARSPLRYGGNHCDPVLPAERMSGLSVTENLFFTFGTVRTTMW